MPISGVLSRSAAVGSQYGSITGFAAGGLLGGAAAGGTSAVLYRAAGYNTNIGLAIATGAAGGLIAGGFYGVGSEFGTWGGLAGSIASAPASGAVSAAITGGDPGAGALLAMRDFGMRMGVSAIIIYANYSLNYSFTKQATVTKQTTVDQSGAVSPNDERVLVAAVVEFGTEGAAADAAEAAQYHTPGGGVVGRAATITKEFIYRKALGVDGGVSRHIIERSGGNAISRTHQVLIDGKIIHQHQTHIGVYGTERQFPNKWIEYHDIGR